MSEFFLVCTFQGCYIRKVCIITEWRELSLMYLSQSTMKRRRRRKGESKGWFCQHWLHPGRVTNWGTKERKRHLFHISNNYSKNKLRFLKKKNVDAQNLIFNPWQLTLNLFISSVIFKPLLFSVPCGCYFNSYWGWFCKLSVLPLQLAHDSSVLCTPNTVPYIL